MTVVDREDLGKAPYRPFGRSRLTHLLLPLVGVVCLAAPHTVMGWLPYVLGGAMALVGAADLVVDVRRPDQGTGRISPGMDVVLVVLGGMLAVRGEASLDAVGFMWGFFGLAKAAYELDEAFCLWRAREPMLLALGTAAFELVLGLLLVAAPLANIEHHVLLLGVELLVYPFRVHKVGGKTQVEV